MVGLGSFLRYEFWLLASQRLHLSIHEQCFMRWPCLRGLLPASALGRVRFVGVVPYEESRTYYEQATALVFPSLWPEPFGLPVIEAMAYELPVIASDFGAFPEIIKRGETGILIERGNSAALAAAMSRLIEEPRLRESMGKVGRVRVEQLFSWKDYSNKWYETYKSLLKSGENMQNPGGDSGLTGVSSRL